MVGAWVALADRCSGNGRLYGFGMGALANGSCAATYRPLFIFRNILLILGKPQTFATVSHGAPRLQPWIEAFPPSSSVENIFWECKLTNYKIAYLAFRFE